MWKLLNVAAESNAAPSNTGLVLGSAMESSSTSLPGDAPASAPKEYKYTTPNISSYVMTSKACGDLGFKQVASLKTEGDATYFIVDVSAYTDKVDIESGADEKTIIIKRWGIGFRVAIVAWNLKVGATANLGLVAASTQLNVGKSSLEAQAFAGDISMLGDIAKIVEFTGEKFDAQTLKNMAGFVGKLALVIARNGKWIPPRQVSYGVLNPNLYNPDHIVASNTFAAERLARGEGPDSLDGWMAGRYHEAWRNDIFIPSIVGAAYENFGVQGFHGTGTDAQRKEASDLKSLGDA